MKKLTMIVSGSLVGFLLATTIAFAWANPQLSAKCAQDSSEYDFDIILQPESNQIIDFSFDSGYSPILMTTDFATSGTHAFTTPTDLATDLYARYQSDHNAKTSVTINKNLCKPKKSGGGNSGHHRSSSGHGSVTQTSPPVIVEVATTTAQTPPPTFVRLSDIPPTGYYGD